ncbi:hypothetical protein BJ138DRAFT_1131392 [Hygrophoropsis aurantiaca]|uniref:Uncharacterized protein n=1 Tax=Hygrophoropsis aurantiaca TaxID=72124 RepID=A0ACB7ZQN7_9AGAM|nr:hypothetical protein BJ138DRAFT_1131392 [Hygrophoropsis aurantiaca]
MDLIRFPFFTCISEPHTSKLRIRRPHSTRQPHSTQQPALDTARQPALDDSRNSHNTQTPLTLQSQCARRRRIRVPEYLWLTVRPVYPCVYPLLTAAPGALIATTWAALHHLGRAGYLDACRAIVGAARKIAEGVLDGVDLAGTEFAGLDDDDDAIDVAANDATEMAADDATEMAADDATEMAKEDEEERKKREEKRRMRALGLDDGIPELYVLGNPVASVVAFGARVSDGSSVDPRSASTASGGLLGGLFGAKGTAEGGEGETRIESVEEAKRRIARIKAARRARVPGPTTADTTSTPTATKNESEGKDESEGNNAPPRVTVDTPPRVTVDTPPRVTVDIMEVGDAMGRRGWHLNALADPPAVHIACTVRVWVFVWCWVAFVGF